MRTRTSCDCGDGDRRSILLASIAVLSSRGFVRFESQVLIRAWNLALLGERPWERLPRSPANLSNQTFCIGGPWNRFAQSVANRQNARYICFEFLSISCLAARLGEREFERVLIKSGKVGQVRNSVTSTRGGSAIRATFRPGVVAMIPDDYAVTVKARFPD